MNQLNFKQPHISKVFNTTKHADANDDNSINITKNVLKKRIADIETLKSDCLSQIETAPSTKKGKGSVNKIELGKRTTASKVTKFKLTVGDDEEMQDLSKQEVQKSKKRTAKGKEKTRQI